MKIGILLFHSLTGMPSELKPLAQHLVAQGFQVETPLLRGHGRTHRDLLKTTWQDWLEGTQEALGEMRLTCDAIYVGGLSMGAILAASLAALNPDIHGLIALSPHMGVMQDNLHVAQCLLPVGTILKPLHDRIYRTEKPPYGLKDEHLQRKIEQAVASADQGQTARYGLYRTYLGSIYQMLDLIAFCKKRGSQVQCPTLILQSLEDTVAKIENATLLYACLGSMHKQIRMITGCNHMMSVDLRKQDVACWVEGFVRKHESLPFAVKRPASEPAPLHVDVVAGFYSSDPGLSGLSDYAKSLMHMMDILEKQGLPAIQLHRLIVRDGQHPVLCLPVFESRIDSKTAAHIKLKKRHSWTWLMKLAERVDLTGASRVLVAGLPADDWHGIRMSTPVMQEAWHHAGLALEAMQRAMTYELFVFPQAELTRLPVSSPDEIQLDETPALSPVSVT